MRRFVAILLVSPFVACSSSEAGAPLQSSSNEPVQEGSADAGTSAVAAPDGPVMDATSESLWQSLLVGDWSMPPGQEGYVCVRHTLTEDIFVSAFEAVNPVGTHHTLLTVGEPDGPDGTSECGASDNHTFSLYGSGVGTNPMIFPEGIAVRLRAGTQLLLNLHLYNAATDTITGTSGTRFKQLAEQDVVEEAEGILAGTVALDIPPHEETRHVGGCTMTHDVTVFAVAPHMHQLGTHATVVAERSSGQEVVLHDGPYDFDEQVYYMLDPIELSAGERIRVECTHLNTTDETVVFGDSSFDEMCLTGIYWYPANASPFICLD